MTSADARFHRRRSNQLHSQNTHELAGRSLRVRKWVVFCPVSESSPFDDFLTDELSGCAVLVLFVVSDEWHDNTLAFLAFHFRAWPRQP